MSTDQPEHFLLLSLAGHSPTPSDATLRGAATGNVVRCLNSAGRWAAQGTTSLPLLAWPSNQPDGARAAAERTAKARDCAIEVVSGENATSTESREIQWFTDAFESALLAPAAQSSARARRLRTEADKLEAFCMVVRAASAATDHHEFGDVSRAATKALRAKFGSGSITSAFAWLTERAGQDALQSVLAGEVELTGPLSLQQVVQATALAQKAERLQDKR
jgi:hypothetical protein